MIDTRRILEAVPSPLELAQLLGLRMAKRARRERVVVLCPWHAEKHPSCTITVRPGRGLVAYCQSCQRGGDAFGLFAAVDGLDPRLDFPEVARGLAELLGVHLEERATLPRVRRDPVVDLAIRIDTMADRWLAGGELLRSDHEAIARSSWTEVHEAMRLLRVTSQDHARADAELDRLADAYERRATAA